MYRKKLWNIIAFFYFISKTESCIIKSNMTKIKKWLNSVWKSAGYNLCRDSHGKWEATMEEQKQSTSSNYFKGLSRRDYIQKAHEIIQQEGIQAVSIRRIAKEMGCSSASLYRYFDNVSELLYYAELRILTGKAWSTFA